MNYVIKCIVIDDNFAAIDLLSHYLEINESTTLVESFHSPIEALSFLSKCQIDLIFLDIDMPEMNGMDFLTIIESDLKYGRPAVVITTAHSDYALPALETSRYTRGFLRKPFAYNKLLSTLEKIRVSTTLESKISIPDNDEENFLFVKTILQSRKAKYLKIQKSDVIYIEGGANYPTLYTHSQAILIRSTLNNLSYKLKDQLIRVHKSFLVNKRFIKEITSHFLLLENEKQIPISPSYRTKLIELYINR